MNRKQGPFQDCGASRTAAIALITLASAAIPASAGTLSFANGSFSNVTISSLDVNTNTNGVYPSFEIGNVNPGDPSTPTGGTGTIASWSIVNPSLGDLNCLVGGAATDVMCGNGNSINNGLNLWANPGALNGNVSPDGGNYVLIDGDSTYGSGLQQTITGLTINQTYALYFYQAAGEQTGFGTLGSVANVNWGVCLSTSACTTANATNAPTMSFVEGSAVSVVPWNLQRLTFTATATTETLTFLAEGPNGAPPFLMLDGVSFVQTPEPATAALIGLGIAGLSLARRLKRKA